MTHSSRLIVVSAIVLIGLIASLYMLRKKAQLEKIPTDTLRVDVDGFDINGEEIQLEELESIYASSSKPRKLHVIFDEEVSFEETWKTQEILKNLDEERDNLTVTGLLEGL